MAVFFYEVFYYTKDIHSKVNYKVKLQVSYKVKQWNEHPWTQHPTQENINTAKTACAILQNPILLPAIEVTTHL